MDGGTNFDYQSEFVQVSRITDTARTQSWEGVTNSNTFVLQIGGGGVGLPHTSTNVNS